MADPRWSGPTLAEGIAATRAREDLRNGIQPYGTRKPVKAGKPAKAPDWVSPNKLVKEKDSLWERAADNANALRPASIDDQRNARFGNDMAWLDDMFKEDPAAAINAARSMGTTSDQGAQDAQRQGVNQFFDIANNGGATAMERSRRQKARGETENWLLGQREADMQGLAQRGMSGGGAEIAALLGDRQAAASRLSQADLDTDAALEQRAIDALTSGTTLAGDMESRSNAYQQNNADLISSSAARTKQFLQNAYQQTMANRQAWDANVLNQQVGVASDMAGRGQQDNQYGYGTGQGLAMEDSGRITDSKTNFNSASNGMWNGTTPGVLATGAQANQAKSDMMGAQGQLGADAFKTGLTMGYGGGGAAGGAGAAAGGAGGFWGQAAQQAGTQAVLAGEPAKKKEPWA